MIKKFRDLSLPAIGFGTYTLKFDSIFKALKAGYKHIDTAKMYGNESEVGDALKSSGISRSEITITTKIWHDRLERNQILADVDDSLKKLKTDYIDLLLIHWPSSKGVALEETLGAFEEVKKLGKAKAIGISNFTPEMQEKAMKITSISCNQVEYHPFLSQQKLIKICEANNAALTAYRPIAKNKVKDNNVIKELASKYGKKPSQITLRWLIQQEPVVAIPRSTNEVHMIENLEIFDFELSDSEMKEIYSLNKDLRQIKPAYGPW